MSARRRAAWSIGAAVLGGSQVLLVYRQPCWREAARPSPRCADRFERPKHPLSFGEARVSASGSVASSAQTAVVVGAGVAGICTAYQLARRGFEVLVLDTRSGAAAEGSASAAAAGGMDSGHKFSRPADWWRMGAQLLPRSDFIFFHLSWPDVCCDLFFWRWLMRFATESLLATEAHSTAKSEKFLPIVDWGIEETIRVMKEVPGLEAAAYSADSGSVMILGHATGGFPHFSSGASVPLKEALHFEPLLGGSDEAAEARYILKDGVRVGECVHFTQHLAEYCEKSLAVRIAPDSAVQGFDVDALGNVVCVHTSRGDVDVGGGSVVLCGGAWSGVLCDMLGFFCPVYPLKGYTLLVDVGDQPSPQRLVYNTAVYAVPAGPRLRIASIGSLGGWSVAVDGGIEADVRREAERLLPALAEQIRKASAVAGLRPFSADEMPLVGRVPGFRNLSLNTGPGHTGWKCSAGFAELAASAVTDAQSSANSPPEGATELLAPAGRLGISLTGPRFIRIFREAFDLFR